MSTTSAIQYSAPSLRIEILQHVVSLLICRYACKDIIQWNVFNLPPWTFLCFIVLHLNARKQVCTDSSVIVLKNYSVPQLWTAAGLSSRIFLGFAAFSSPSAISSSTGPAAEKRSHSMMLPPPHFTVGIVYFCGWWLTDAKHRRQNSKRFCFFQNRKLPFFY